MSEASCEKNENTSFLLPAVTSHPLTQKKNKQKLQEMSTERSWESSFSTLTVEEAFDLQVADAEAEHGQLVQPRPDLLGEGQQAGELVQLTVEPVSVAFGRVRLGAIGRRWFGSAGTERRFKYRNKDAFKGQKHGENYLLSAQRSSIHSIWWQIWIVNYFFLDNTGVLHPNWALRCPRSQAFYVTLSTY